MYLSTKCCNSSNLRKDCNILLKKCLDWFPLPCIKQNKWGCSVAQYFMRYSGKESPHCGMEMISNPVTCFTSGFASPLTSCLSQSAFLQLTTAEPWQPSFSRLYPQLLQGCSMLLLLLLVVCAWIMNVEPIAVTVFYLQIAFDAVFRTFFAVSLVMFPENFC